MSSLRGLYLWLLAAVASSVLLVNLVVWRYSYRETRWTSFFVGDPQLGAKLFFDKKGCVRCHPAQGVGEESKPEGLAPLSESNSSGVVSAMWNHAPRMWEFVQKERTAYPRLSYEEMAHLLAFLYTTERIAEPGDEIQGAYLFEIKGCVRCHAVLGVGGRTGRDLAEIPGLNGPIRWAEAMWNHAPVMRAGIRELGIPSSKFEDYEMNDLLSFIREVSGQQGGEWRLLPASPERGWALFRRKSCIVCHSVNGKDGKVGPRLGPVPRLPRSVTQFAGLMWNHFPEVWYVQQSGNVRQPTLDGQQMADLMAFLATFRYFEPTGSSQTGATLFAEWGCGQCHGPSAGGARFGPRLRGRGISFTSVMLAASLWGHGRGMYRRAQELKVPWPRLAESGIGDLLSFLNAPPEEGR